MTDRYDAAPPTLGKWSELARAAERLCGAGSAGVATRTSHHPRALAELRQRLDRDAGPATIESGGLHLAAAMLAGVDGAMLWVADRTAPFGGPALARLGWLATGAQDAVVLLEEARSEADLLLHEARHRCANDLHLVGSLLSHHARFASEGRAAAVLETVAGRVMMLSRARQQPPGDLVGGLRACTDALAAQVGDRGIAVSLHVEGTCPPIDDRRAAVLLLAANEFAVNALKHAFGAGGGGRVRVMLAAAPTLVVLRVEDDGIAIPAVPVARRPGSGLDLVTRLVAGIRATLTPPPPGGKCFTIKMTVADAAAHRRDR